MNQVWQDVQQSKLSRSRAGWQHKEQSEPLMEARLCDQRTLPPSLKKMACVVMHYRMLTKPVCPAGSSRSQLPSSRTPNPRNFKACPSKVISDYVMLHLPFATKGNVK